MTDRASGVHQQDAVGNGLQQRGVLLLGEPQRLDGARAAQHVADAVHQQRPVDRFDDEVRGAGVVGEIDGQRVVESGHHDDRHVEPAGQRADVGAGLVAVAFGHFDIEQRDVGHRARARGHRRIAARDRLHREACALERRAGDVAQQAVIVGHQHSQRQFPAHADLRISLSSCSRTRGYSRCSCASSSGAAARSPARPQFSSSRHRRAETQRADVAVARAPRVRRARQRARLACRALRVRSAPPARASRQDNCSRCGSACRCEPLRWQRAQRRERRAIQEQFGAGSGAGAGARGGGCRCSSRRRGEPARKRGVQRLAREGLRQVVVHARGEHAARPAGVASAVERDHRQARSGTSRCAAAPGSRKIRP